MHSLVLHLLRQNKASLRVANIVYDWADDCYRALLDCPRLRTLDLHTAKPFNGSVALSSQRARAALTAPGCFPDLHSLVLPGYILLKRIDDYHRILEHGALCAVCLLCFVVLTCVYA